MDKAKDKVDEVLKENLKKVDKAKDEMDEIFKENLKKMDKSMDAVFKVLEKAGKTDVDNLMQWMKDSKIMEATKESNVRKLFKDVENQQQVDLAKFKDILAKIAAEQSKTADQLAKQLAAEGPKFIDAAIVGLNAFKEALKGAAK